MAAARPCSIASFPNQKSAVRPVEVSDLRRAFEAMLRDASDIPLGQDNSLWLVILAVSKVFPPHTSSEKITALVYRAIALVRVLRTPARCEHSESSVGDMNVEALQPLLEAAARARVLGKAEFDAEEFRRLTERPG